MASKKGGKKVNKGTKAGDYGFRFASKASKVSKSASRKRKSKLDPIRQQFQSLVELANERISQLNEEGLLAQSPTYIKLFGSDGELGQFSLDDKNRFRDIRREINRVNEFLSAEDSTSVGAKDVEKVMKALEHGISFQKQGELYERYGDRFYGTDDDRMKFALKIYRQLAETEALAIGKGKGQFGSDNLINIIYDAVDGYDPNSSARTRNSLEKKAMEIGYNVLNQFKMNDLMGFLSGSPNAGSDVNIVEQIKKAKSAEEYFQQNPWLYETKW